MLIIMAFPLFLFELCFKNYGCPSVTIPKYFIFKKCYFRYAALTCTYFILRSINSVAVLTCAANTAMGQLEDM